MMKLAVVILVCLNAFAAFAGDSGRGGTPDAITVDAYTKFITGKGLRSSVENYLNTLDLSEMNDPVDAEAKRTFIKMLKNGDLAKDISTSGTYFVGIEYCKSVPGGATHPAAESTGVRAWTNTGHNNVPNIGGRICFDVERLVADHMSRGLRLKEAAVELTALTYHEYVHHFQNDSKNDAVIAAQEKQANALASYVLRSVEFVPLLRWTKNAPALTQEVGCVDNSETEVDRPWRNTFESAKSLSLSDLPKTKTFYFSALATSSDYTSAVVYFDLSGLIPKAYIDAYNLMSLQESYLAAGQATELSKSIVSSDIRALDVVARPGSADSDLQTVSVDTWSGAYNTPASKRTKKVTIRKTGNWMIFRGVICREEAGQFTVKTYYGTVDTSRDLMVDKLVR